MLQIITDWAIKKSHLHKENQELQEFFDIMHRLAEISRMRDMAEGITKLAQVRVSIANMGMRSLDSDGNVLQEKLNKRYRVAQEMYYLARRKAANKGWVEPDNEPLMTVVKCVSVVDKNQEI